MSRLKWIPQREPQSKQPEQHQPHQEGGNGAPGIQPTLNERAKPPPESAGRPLERRGALFDCVSLKITIPPHHLRAMVREDVFTEEQAREEEQEWLAELRTSSRELLQDHLRQFEELRERSIKRQKPQQVQDIEETLSAIREELRQRGFSE